MSFLQKNLSKTIYYIDDFGECVCNFILNGSFAMFSPETENLQTILIICQQVSVTSIEIV